MIKRFGKPSASNIRLKKDFFTENQNHIYENKNIINFYLSQPDRLLCKNCNHKLRLENDFVKNGVGFKICAICTHLNGAHQDTKDFTEFVYTEENGQSYSKTYLESDLDTYNYKLSSVYIPKAEFLYSSILDDSVNPNEKSYLDFGSGSGFFVAAMKKVGLKNISATDVSKTQVEYGNAMLGTNLAKVHKIEDTDRILGYCEANVLSMIGVLEHLASPREALKSIQKNKNIEYLFISVPLFSLSVYLEMFSPSVYHRHLLGNGGHTHLYTQKSLEYIISEFGFEICSEWWFGADIIDLYRNILVQMQQNHTSSEVIDSFNEMFTPMIDSIQLELDKKFNSSEVHLLLKKKKL